MLFCRNISYPYGDSNRIVGGRGASDGKHFIPLRGQQRQLVTTKNTVDQKHFIPIWGQQHLAQDLPIQLRTKHFLPLWGQQRDGEKDTGINRGKHFFPLWGQQLGAQAVRLFLMETFHTPMGTATIEHFVIKICGCAKHFIPLWGQQQSSDSSRPPQSGNISYPYGDSNVEDAATAVIAVETFHTPSGTKRKPICPIGHIGFYFIRSCYSHVTPPIPSAVLMPTPAYGAKCSSRFAIVR